MARIQVAELFAPVVADVTGFAKSLGGATSDAKSWATGIGRTIGKAGLAVVASGAALATGAVLGLGVAIGKMTLDAAAVQGTVNTFNNLVESVGGDAVKAMEMLRASTRNMVADADLMAASNKFLAMGVAETAEEAANLAEVSTQLGMAMGEDATASMENFALMMSNQSIPRLDSFGISSGAVRTRILELMEATQDMTREEAFKIAVMEQSAITMAKVGEQSDTVAGTIGRIKTTIANTTLGIGQAFLPVLQELLTPLTDIAQDVGPQLIEWARVAAQWLGEKLPLAIAWLSEVAAAILPTLQEWGQWLGENIPLAVKWLSKKVAEFLPTLQLWSGQLLDLGKKILPLFAAAFQFVVDNWKVFAALAAVVVAVIIALNAPIILIIGALTALYLAWVNDWGGIRTTVENITAAIRATIERWMAVLQGWWERHGDSVMTVVNFLWDGIQSIVGAVTAAISSLLTAATELWHSLWSSHGSALTDLITTLWEGVKTIFSAAFEALGFIFDAFAAAIEGDWEAFGEHLRTAWDTLWEAIITALRNANTALITLVVSLVQSIRDKFTSIDWARVGRSIIEGIKAGILAAAGALAQAAIDAAMAALAAVMGALGAESPSRAFMAVGRSMMEGMALGISGTAHVPAIAAVEASTHVLDQSHHETWNIAASYAYQSERTLRDDVRMMQLLST